MLTSVMALAISGLVLAGWVLDIPRLRSFLPGTIEMKAITALTSSVLSIGLLLAWRGGARIRRTTLAVTAGLVVLTALLSAAQYLARVDLGIDRLLIVEKIGATATVHPGRMAPNTIISFFLLAAALLLVDTGRKGIRRLSSALAPAAFLIALLALIGYHYGAQGLLGFERYNPMAFPTALNFAFLSVSVMAVRKEMGTLGLLFSERAAGSMSRRLIPAAILTPVIIGWLRLRGQQRGLYGSEFGVALFAVATVLVFLAFVAWTAKLLHREDRQRAMAEERLRQLVAAQERMVAAELRSQDVSQVVARHAADMTYASGSAVETLIDGQWCVRAATGSAGALLDRRRQPDPDLDSQLIMVTDTIRETRFHEQHCILASARSAVFVPINHEGTVIGLLHLYGSRPSHFTAADTEVAQLVCSMAAVSLSHATEFENRQLRLEMTSSRLEDATQMFRAFMENAPAIAFLKDDEGRVVYVNDRFKRTFDTMLSALRLLPSWEWLPGEMVKMARATDRSVLAGELVESIVQATRPDGTAGHWFVLKFPVVIRGRTHVGGVAVDVSREKEAESALRELNIELEERVTQRTAQLEAANKELEAFSYSVSHDLRAPLRAVDGYARILAEDYSANLDSEGIRFIQTIRDEARRMGTLIDDLLAFSRLSRKSIAFNRVDVGELARKVFEDLQRKSPNRAELIIHDSPLAAGDESLLYQVLTNLLSNALKFSAMKEPPRIEIGGEREGTDNRYWVKDNGAGFDMKYVHKLFGVFQRLHSSEEFEGTGVGLAIVQRVVQSHGGRVWAVGAVGEGSTFFFTLPSLSHWTGRHTGTPDEEELAS